MTDRPREVSIWAFPSNRRLVTAAMRAGRRMTPMHGLVDVDVTEAVRLLGHHDPPLSFSAFVVASVARAAAADPAVHAYRDWRGRLVTHRHVDVTTIVEIETPDGPFPLAHVVRDADVRTVADLSDELRHVKSDPRTSGSGRLVAKGAPIAARIPGAIPTMYRLMARSVRLRRQIGTVAVTAVGMFGGGGGFGISAPSLMSLQVLVGGISPRPRAVDARVEIRDVLDLTITIDHDVIDGAPAARFGADLRRRLETAEVLLDR